MDLTRRPTGKWIVDFGRTMSASDAALYEEPFRWVKERVYPMRVRVRRKAHRLRWWRHADPRPGMWEALDGLSRYIATPTVAKHRLFAWCDVRICPDHQLIVIARDDDTTFGILHSRFHELWSLRLCTWLGKGNDPRYTPSTTFETFPFPIGLAPDVAGSRLRGKSARGRDLGGRAPTRRPARPLAQPARMGRMGRRACSRISAPSRPSRRGSREGAQETHADKPLQRAPSMARGCARGSRCCRCGCLRLVRRHQRRRRPARAVGSQRGLVSSPALLVWCCGGNEVHGWRGARRPPSRLPWTVGIFTVESSSGVFV